MSKQIGDFKLIEGYGNKDWLDVVTKDKIAYWGKYIYSLRTNASGLVNEELISDKHLNLVRRKDNILIEGILIANTSKDMLTAGCILDRFIKQALPTIECESRNKTPD